MEIVMIYTGKNACKQCLGWKRVDDHDGASWKYWAALPGQSAIAVKWGFIKAVECPRCKGTGIEPEGEKES
jgi:hypothetical protein